MYVDSKGINFIFIIANGLMLITNESMVKRQEVDYKN